MAVSSSNPWARNPAPGPHDTGRSQLRPTAQQSVSLSYKYAPTLSLPLSSSPLAKFSNPPASLPFSKFPMAQEDVIATEPSPVQQPSPKKPSSPPAVVKSGSFREESNLVSDLQEPEKAALDELRSLLRSELAAPPPPPAADPPAPPAGQAENADDGAKTVEAIESTVVPAAPQGAAESPAALWGVPLLEDERTDTVLLKFLRARDFRAKESMEMIRQTLKWRKEFGIEKLAGEDLGVAEMGRAVFMGGADRKGHPVCYNVYGEFQNRELYEKAFGGDGGEKRGRFLRWRIQYLEKGIRELLDFSPAGVSTMVQVTDLKDSPGLLKAELRQALDILQNNYPEFVAKQIFINVPWWYLAFNKMISPFLTQRTKSKFVFAGPSRSAETLFNYISPEQVPVRFGGLLTQENDPDFAPADVVTEVTVKPGSKQIIEMPAAEKCLLVWELRVLGWDVSIGAEFVPSSEDGYTVIIDKLKKLGAKDEAVAKNSFKIAEPGKVVITVDNATSKKKKLLYRYKSKECTESV